ncbi:S41 family peptidase [Devosia sp. LjRoot16]|uniref:S41 family peptidase n=1 Tax=Devosia sp. LjRoot16 TaxID=3342271 RepID=UPI003F509583
MGDAAAWAIVRADAAAAGAHRGRLAILIDGTVGSAAEDFAMPFKDNGRALLVGEATAGSSGQPHHFDLGEGFRAWVGAKRETFPDGARFEGVGIAPDLETIQQAADLRETSDRVLNGALASMTS